MGFGIFRRNKAAVQPAAQDTVQQRSDKSLCKRLRGVFRGSVVAPQQSAPQPIQQPIQQPARQLVPVAKNPKNSQTGEVDLNWVTTLVFNGIVAGGLSYFMPGMIFLGPAIAEGGKEYGGKGLEKALNLGSRAWSKASNLLEGAGVTAEKAGGIAWDIGRHTLPSLPFMFYGGGLFMGATILATATYKLAKSGENKDLNALVKKLARKRNVAPQTAAVSRRVRRKPIPPRSQPVSGQSISPVLPR